MPVCQGIKADGSDCTREYWLKTYHGPRGDIHLCKDHKDQLDEVMKEQEDDAGETVSVFWEHQLWRNCF